MRKDFKAKTYYTVALFFFKRLHVLQLHYECCKQKVSVCKETYFNCNKPLNDSMD